MPAGNYDLTIEQGATFSQLITYKDPSDVAVNLTGYTARMHIRRTKEASSTLAVLTTENNRITLGGAAGTISLAISATDTAAMPAVAGYYDLELVNVTTVTRLLEGRATITREVTR